jgi:hypothetical protein
MICFVCAFVLLMEHHWILGTLLMLVAADII